MEGLKSLQLLTHADELDGHAGHCLDRQSRTAAGIAVQLGHDHAVQTQTLIEGLSHVHGLLTGHGIYYQQDLMGLHIALDIPQLLHELFINLQAACRIDDDDIIGMALGIRQSLFGDSHGICALGHGENRQPQLLTHHLQLLDSSRAVDICCHQQGTLALFLQGQAQLAGRSGLAGALQTHHHDDSRRIGAHVDAALGAAHEVGKFLINNLHHYLGRGEGLQDILAHRPLLHGLDEVLDHLEVHIGLKECHAHFTHGFIDIVLRQLAMAPQLLESLLQAVR